MGFSFGMVCSHSPLLHIEFSRLVQRHRVAVKEVRHHNKIAIHDKLISDELSVCESIADNICESMNRMLSTEQSIRRLNWRVSALTSRLHTPWNDWEGSWYRPRSHLDLWLCLMVFHHAGILGSSMIEMGWKSFLEQTSTEGADWTLLDRCYVNDYQVLIFWGFNQIKLGEDRLNSYLDGFPDMVIMSDVSPSGMDIGGWLGDNGKQAAQHLNGRFSELIRGQYPIFVVLNRL